MDLSLARISLVSGKIEVRFSLFSFFSSIFSEGGIRFDHTRCLRRYRLRCVVYYWQTSPSHAPLYIPVPSGRYAKWLRSPGEQRQLVESNGRKTNKVWDQFTCSDKSCCLQQRFGFFFFFYLHFLYRCTNQIYNLVSLFCPVIFISWHLKEWSLSVSHGPMVVWLGAPDAALWWRIGPQ